MIIDYFWAIFMLGVLIFVHELGHFIFAKYAGVKVLKFSLGFGPKIIGKKVGETEYLISLLPLGGYVKMLGEDPEEGVSPNELDRAFSNQSVSKRFYIAAAGPLFNLLLAYVIFIVFLSFKLPIMVPKLESFSTSIDAVVEDSPALKAGLKPGDLILEINDEPVTTWNEMTSIIKRYPGKEIELKIKRGDKVLIKKITPQKVVEKDENGKEIVVGKIGIVKHQEFNVIKAEGIIDAPIKAIEAVWQWSAFVCKTAWMLIKDAIGMTGGISSKNIGGPISIVKETSKAASAGLINYLMIMSIISINLGILNLFPIPVLDGGHIAFLGVEALRRKPISQRTQAFIQKVGLALLLALMALAFYNDIMRIFIK